MDADMLRVAIAMTIMLAMGFFLGKMTEQIRLVWNGKKPKETRKPNKLNEERVRAVEGMCRQSEDLRDCVTWIAEEMREEFVNALSNAKPKDDGYAYALAKMAGAVYACERIAQMWESIAACEMADGMKRIREEEEKARDRGISRGGAEARRLRV